MNVKAWLTLLAFLLWTWGSWWRYTHKINPVCGDRVAIGPPTSPDTPPSIASTDFPLAFGLNSAEPVLGKEFDSIRSALMKSVTGSDTLVIQTWAFANENGGTQLAAERAAKIRSLFPQWPGSRIIIRSILKEEAAKISSDLFEASAFSIHSGAETKLVQENADRVTVYFPTSASAKKLDAATEDFLAQLVARLKTEPAKNLLITGHTDNQGSPTANERLGLQRAEFLKSRLVTLGLEQNRINAISKGPGMPAADNATAAGRDKNRRVEIEVQ